MDKYIYPKVRPLLRRLRRRGSRDIGASPRLVHQARFRSDLIFYQYCQTGNGIGSAGLVILENGKPVANFLAEEAGWTEDSSVLPDINQNGVDEIELYYSGGMHQGDGGIGVDIVEYSAGSIKGSAGISRMGIRRQGPVFGFKVTVNPGKVPAFFKQKYLQNAAGNWRQTGKVLPLKLGEIVCPFEPIK